MADDKRRSNNGSLHYQRKKVEDALKESQQRYRTLLENSGSSVTYFDKEYKLAYANRNVLKDFDCREEDIIGKSIFDLFPKEKAEIYAKRFDRILETQSGYTLEDFAEFPNKKRWFLASIQPVKSAAGEITGIQCIATDITERKEAEKACQEANVRLEEQTRGLEATNKAMKLLYAELEKKNEELKISLEEKEVLLKEVHHRVKNNLQVISSLLNLQAGYIENKKDLAVFRDSQSRVRSMALIHEKLYKSQNLSTIDFSEYVRSLVSELYNSYGANADIISIDVNAKDINLDIDLAVPFGLIVNELVSNSLKYAFPKKRRGNIKIKMSADDGNYILVVKDDGIGLPTGLDFDNTKTLGLQLVKTLVEQIEGVVEIKRDKGVGFIITFKRHPSTAL